MTWYYHLNGQNQGPVDTTELQSLISQNVITPETLVWSEGMAQWQAYKSSTAVLGGAVTASQVCAECGKRFPEEDMLQYENSWVCATCKPLFFQRIKEGITPKGSYVLASIGKRFVAIFIDGLLIGVVLMIFLLPVFIPIFTQILADAGKGGQPPVPVFTLGMRFYMYLIEYGLPAAYEIFFIGKYGATLGKMAMKIKVIRADGTPVSYALATGRHFAKLLSGIILYIGYLMAFWDEEKRALHDRLCKTRVIATDS